MERSLIDYAYEFVSESKKACKFTDIWKYVVKSAELSEEDAGNKISNFYTNLMLDGRFVTIGQNLWNLRTRETFDKVHIDMNDAYADTDVQSDDAEENQEQIEEESMYNEKPKEASDFQENIDGNEETKEDSEEETDEF